MASLQSLLLLAALCLSLPALIAAFNVDVTSKVVHQGPTGACEQETCMFGFSVAQHRDKGTPWLLVGAPSAESGQPGVSKGGAVYKCQPRQPGSCEQIPFDTKGVAYAPTGEQYETKSGQWFGSTVQSSGEDGVVLACAPRYVWHSNNYLRREPVGTCYTSSNGFADFLEYSPCRTRKWGYHRQGSCQAGLGAAITESGDQMFVGAPGSWYWQGQLFTQSLSEFRHQHKTGEGSPDDDDSYLGYSVATGEFSGDGDRADVAVGMPRGAGLTGKVLIYNSNLTNLHNLTGTQIGAYFGYSVASADLNGDGLDDLIVGAPMWTNYEEMGKFETGRVYVVYQDESHKFQKFDTLDGDRHKARFGLSVAGAGNLNLDGYSENSRGVEDLIVGAPYDGPDHRGAVYIFLGAEDGIVKKPAQVIYAETIHPTLRTFGWSLSAGMDLDRNEYPDLLIGAYASSHAVYLRSAPVVHLSSSAEYLVASKQIDLDKRKCLLRDGVTRVACAKVRVAMSYHGVGVPESIMLEIQYMLDAKKEQAKRMFFLQQENVSTRNRTISIRKGQEWEDEFEVYLTQGNINDKLTALDLQVRYSLAQSSSSSRTARDLRPVLGQFEKMAVDSISIQKDCGSDNVCIPDLSLEAKHAGAYIIGSGEKMELSATLSNAGEDAFNAMFYLQIPRGINYIKASYADRADNVLCSPPTGMNNRTLQCSVGNPFPANTDTTVNVFLQPSEENQDQFLSEYVFIMAVNSSNPEAGSDQGDNERLIRFPVRTETDWRVTGTSKPSQVEYNITQEIPDKYYFEDELGAEIFHVYDVKNRGPSTISEADVFILWPSFTEGDREHLLYLLGVDYDRSKVTCQGIDNINPLYVKTIGSRGYSAAQTGGGGALFASGSSGSGSSSSSYSSGGASFSSSSSSGGAYGAGGRRGGSAGQGVFVSNGEAGGGEASYTYESSSSQEASSSSTGGGGYSQGGRSYSQGGGSYSQGGGSYSQGGGSYSQGGGSYAQGGGSYSQGGGSYVQGGGSYAQGGAKQGGSSYSYEQSSSSSSSSGGAAMAGGAGSGSAGSAVRGGGANYGGETRFGSSTSYRGNYGSVAAGAEETRLGGADGNKGSRVEINEESSYSSSSSLGSAPKSSYDYEKEFSSSSSSSGRGSAGSVSGGSSGPSRGSGYSSSSSSRGTVATSGWKLLDNGTYIRIYDTQNTGRGGYRGSSGGSYSSGGSSSSMSGGSTSMSGGSSSSMSGGSSNMDSGWVGGAASGSAGHETSDSGSSESGWERQPDGTMKKTQSSWSSWSSSSGGNQQGGSSFGAAGSASQGGSGSYGHGSSSQGGGSYGHGSAGAGAHETGDSGRSESGWERQPDGTMKKTQSSWTSWSSSSEGASAGRGGSSQGGAGGASYGFSDHYQGSFESGSGRQQGGGQAAGSRGSETSLGGSSGGFNSNTNAILDAARGPGDYHGTMRKSELEKEAGGAVFSSREGSETRHQVEGTRYRGNVDVGNNFGASSYGGAQGGSVSQGGSSYSSQSGSSYGSGSQGGASYGSDTQGGSSYSSGSQGGSLYNAQGGSSYSSQGGSSHSSGSQGGGSHSSGSQGGSSYSSQGGSSHSSGSQGGSSGEVVDSSSSSTAPKGKWVWSEVNNKWEWQEAAFSLGASPKVVEESYAQAKSSGSSSYSAGGSGFGARGHGENGYFESGHISTQEGGSSSSGGGGFAGGYQSGGRGGGASHDSGSDDSGWVLLDNGTYVRRTNSWSSHSSEGSYGGAHLSQDDINELQGKMGGNGGSGYHVSAGAGAGGMEDGDSGANSTGWVRQADGTMIKKSSSWTSWSKSSSSDSDLHPDQIHRIRQDLESKARQHLDTVHMDSRRRDGDVVRGPNVEPGFEHHRRVKREYDPFDAEIRNYCSPGRCTMIQCKVGPLAKDESVLFKIRSRLFEETQIKSFRDKVKVSSKLVTRITRLPYLQDPSTVQYQTHQVTTDVFPSEMGEASIPWWVWLLAAIFGLLLLALIICCLAKCGFFKRKRPTDMPEKQPLNGY